MTDESCDSVEDALEVLASAVRVLRDRQDMYGDPSKVFHNIGNMWCTMGIRINGDRLSASQVALAMIAVKLCRNPDRDSLVDIAGYAALAAALIGGR